MRYTVRPISDRTAFTGSPIDSRFTVTWSDCLELLERELGFLDATDLVIECDVREQDLRLDGMIRSNARAASPAVRVAFESNVGPLTYATDAFRRPSWRRGGMQEDWQHNVYAIALSLEALRKVDRYGVTKRGEQYAGFKAIGAGRAMPSSHMTAEDALRVVHELTGFRLEGDPLAETTQRAYRAARAAVHPDRHDGDRTLWDQVEQAAAVLGVTR
jgi:hypothetical protein